MPGQPAADYSGWIPAFFTSATYFAISERKPFCAYATLLGSTAGVREHSWGQVLFCNMSARTTPAPSQASCCRCPRARTLAALCCGPDYQPAKLPPEPLASVTEAPPWPGLRLRDAARCPWPGHPTLSGEVHPWRLAVAGKRPLPRAPWARLAVRGCGSNLRTGCRGNHAACPPGTVWPARAAPPALPPPDQKPGRSTCGRWCRRWPAGFLRDRPVVGTRPRKSCCPR